MPAGLMSCGQFCAFENGGNSSMGQRYKTIYQQGGAEIVEKKSRFIASCAPVTTEEEAIAYITMVRADHRTATHNVYAYNLRCDNLCRYSDDGEPQGTAGLPILDILKRRDITDAVVVVTRYFGGTLLGTGGLVRAYSEAAAAAIRRAGVAVMELCAVYEWCCEYPLYDRAQKLITGAGATILNASFSEQVTLQIAVLSERAPGLLGNISELARGQKLPKFLFDRFERVSVEWE
jgi:uncharacterized YigZ family protein